MKILLIIPAYNEENCITKVIDELVERYPQYDYIIVNDGSTDQSIPTIMPFLTQHSNLKIIEQSNQGVSIARNKGIQEASGEYILSLIHI